MVVGITEFVFVAIAFALVLALFALLYSSKFFQISLVRSRRPPPIEPVEPDVRAPKGRKAQKQSPQTDKTGKIKSGKTQPQQRKTAGKNQQASNQWVVKDNTPDDIVKFYGDIRGQGQKKKALDTKVVKEVKTVKPKAVDKADKEYQEVTQPKKEKKPKEKAPEKKRQKKEKKEEPKEPKEPEVDPNEVDEKGETALHHAASEGNIEQVLQLLKNKANTNVQNKAGYTPLHLAAQNNHASTCMKLLAAKADPTIKTFHGLMAEDLTTLNWLKEKLFEGHSVTLNINVPQNKRGALLGFRGLNVAELSSKTGTVIKVPPRDSDLPVTITGRKQKAEEAKASIEKIIQEAEEPEKRHPVPKEKHGVIIGKGGWQLKIIESCGVRIIIPKPDSPDGDIRIRGKPEKVELAIQKIEALLEKDRKRQEQRRPRQPKASGSPTTAPHETTETETETHAPEDAHESATTTTTTTEEEEQAPLVV